MSRTTAALTEPTSVTIAPGLRLGAISAASAAHAPTGTDRMTRSAPFTASPACTQPRSTRRKVSAVSIVALVRAAPVIMRESPLRRIAWLIEEPMRPMPIRATCSNMGSDLISDLGADLGPVMRRLL